MKKLLTFILIISTLSVVAQSKRTGKKRTNKPALDTPAVVTQPGEDRCRFTFFKNTRQISSSICKIEGFPLRGSATAYDQSGKVIYHRETRRYGGHASVDFTYHANGAVHTAHYSSAPDAGIQWYNSTHYFDPEGRLADVKSQSHEDMISTRIDTNRSTYNLPVNPRYEVVRCAEIWVTSVWVDNQTADTLRIEHRLTGMREPAIVTQAAPGSTVKVADLIDAERFANVTERMQITVFNQRNKRKLSIPAKDTREQIVSRTEKRITHRFQ